jgi:hypothetical protein
MATPFPPPVTISLEALAYFGLVFIALALRFAELGVTVLSHTEAHEALAVFRAMYPTYPGATPIATHPLMYAANTIMMGLLGTENAIPRLATVFLSVGVMLSPLLFRRWIGSANALLVSTFLAISPALLISGRSMAGSVWSVMLALLIVWSVGRFAEQHGRRIALFGSACVGLLLVGSEPAGFLLGIMLIIGTVFAVVFDDNTELPVRERVSEVIKAWPWVSGALTAAMILFLVGTVGLLKIGAAGAFGEVLTRGLGGFVYRPYIDSPVAFPLQVSLMYEAVFWIFGGVGMWIVLREGESFFHRVMIGWVIGAVIGCLVYPGAVASHSLWLTIPLVFLSGVAVERILTRVEDRFFDVPVWGPYLHGIGVVAALSVAGINLINIGRTVLGQDPTLTPNIELPRLMLTVLTVALVVILFFLVGSIWGSKAAWRGVGIGVLVFLGMYSWSSGWRASVSGIDDAREPWHVQPVSQVLRRLEGDLTQVSLRASGMPYDMPLVVVAPDDGTIAWMIRHFRKITYTEAVSESYNGPALILPRNAVDPKQEQPKLGAAYVGTDYPLTYQFDQNTVEYWHVLAWMYGRDTRQTPTYRDQIALWVRGDVYGASSVEDSK